jgi:Fe-S-cluster-containing dehydrogenase component
MRLPAFTVRFEVRGGRSDAMNPGQEDTARPDPVDQVFDAEWEARARKTLELSGYQPDLAIQVARDALRVVTGQLKEEEFQQRHHAAYLQEFEVDERPRIFVEIDSDAIVDQGNGTDTATEVGETTETVARPEAAGAGRAPMSRRAALGLVGGGAAALLLADLLQAHAGAANHLDDGGPLTIDASAAAATDDGTPHKVRMGMVVDLTRCEKLLMCAGGCKSGNRLPDGVHWIHTQAFQEPERGDDVHYLVRTCQHCAKAPCVMVCPTTARYRRDDGIVLTDYDLCFGCRYCQVACPYGVNFFGWVEPEKHGGGYEGNQRDKHGRKVIGAQPVGVMGKCTFAVQRQDSPETRGTTFCSMACPNGVIHFGDLNDPESEPRQYLQQRLRDSNGQLSTFRLLEELGTDPSVIFIGQQPSKRAKAVDGPRTHEDWGLVEERRDLLEGPQPWFRRIFGGD